MKHAWPAVLGVLSVVAIGCVVAVGAETFQVGPHLRSLFGRKPHLHTAAPATDTGVLPGPPSASRGVMQDDGALDLVFAKGLGHEQVHVRFPGGRVQSLPFFTRVPAGMYMLEFSGASYKPVLCQVQVRPRGRSHVTFNGKDCRVDLN